jgi:hypothetical protein
MIARVLDTMVRIQMHALIARGRLIRYTGNPWTNTYRGIAVPHLSCTCVTRTQPTDNRLLTIAILPRQYALNGE